MNVLWVILGVYVLLCAIFYFFQHYFFFRPEILPNTFQFEYPFPFEELLFEMDDGAKVSGIYFKVPNSLGVIYYLKGNSRSIKGWGKFAKDFLGKGYDFVMIDYRGFGKSKGRRTEERLYRDTQYVYEWLKERYLENQIVVYGRSLGSGFAAYVASQNQPRLLILDSPYYSFSYQVNQYGFWLPVRWLLRYKIPTHEFVMEVESPIYSIHGTKDRLIPYEQSRKLQRLKPSLNLIPIEGGGHNNLPKYPKYHQSVYAILHGESLSTVG